MCKTTEELLRMKKREKIIVHSIQILIVFLFFVVWEVLADKKIISSFLFSSPSKVWETLITLVSTGEIWRHIWTTLYETLLSCYVNNDFLASAKNLEKYYPNLSKGFYGFLQLYYNNIDRDNLKLKNSILFEDESINNFHQAILYYISGMTDHFAIKVYEEIIGF